MADWFVALSQFNAAHVARDNLERQNFVCYFPKYLERIVHRGLRTWREQPLFGRYFFVELSAAWRKVINTRGVVEVLMSGENPGIVRENLIEDIRSREVGGFVQMPKSNGFRKGQRVTVTDGVFKNLTGIHQGMSREDREFVLLGSMNASVRIAAEDLVAA